MDALVVGVVSVTIPYSSGDFFGPIWALPTTLVLVSVTIPYSSGDFFGHTSGNPCILREPPRNDPLLIG